ncbi:hypothetical protein AAVH_41456, partial [Aphelenchoides avenae]
HASLAAAFAMVFLPIFIVQLVLLTRYANEQSTYNEKSGNAFCIDGNASKMATVGAYPGDYYPY